MKTVTVNGYAKLNLFLDVVGAKNGYHLLDTVVATVDVNDKLALSSRNDGKIALNCSRGLFVSRLSEDNNAYKAAKLFRETFNTPGVTVTLKKNIPVGSGMGGSSADIAAVLRGMAELYDVSDDLKPLADSLGSDSGYLLTGGFARLKGRGELVESLDCDVKLYAVVVTADGGVNTTECFRRFDGFTDSGTDKMADDLISALKRGDYTSDMFYNALTFAACSINPEIGKVLDDVKSLSPRAVSMSGSGSSVFGIFDTPELVLWASSKLKKKYKNVFSVQTLSREELKKQQSSRSLFSI